MLTNSVNKIALNAVVLSVCVQQAIFTEFTHDRKRIGPLNLAMAEHECLQKFTVSENTIIRTQDSRIRGAKFLNESDVGNREDCLSLCCSTRFCDVAVFQEKSPFSCYLFDCGPPDEFLCKFTSHTYYTSAVLAVNRHQLELGIWSTQHQHEAELTDLRSSTEEAKIAKQMTEDQTTKKSTTTTTSTTTTSPLTTVAAVQGTQKDGRKCSRFQFECHSGECLAIYNACDGIPQCKDGSDEGSDLGCPQGQDATIFSHKPNVLDYNRYGNDVSPDYPREEGLGYGGYGKGPGYYDYTQRGQLRNRYNSGRQNGDIGKSASPVYQHDYPDYGLVSRQRDHKPIQQQQQQQPVRPQQPSLLNPSNLQMKTMSAEQNIPSQYQQRQDLSLVRPWQGQISRYPSYPTDSQQSLRQFDPQHGDRLVHLENDYNVPVSSNHMRQNSPLEAPSYLQSNQEHLRNYQSIPSDSQMQNSKGLQVNTQQGINQSNQPQSASQQNDYQGTTNLLLNSAVDKATQLNPSAPQGPSRESAPNAATTSAEHKKNVSSSSTVSETKENHDNRSSQDNPASDLSNKYDGSVAAHSSLSRLEIDIEELTREDETQKSQTSGAVLALSLGVCITALLVVLVGCRIKGVKRRVRRRRGVRSPLEHDADYLVNGMYL